jgi:hypothetical protein
MLSTSAASGGKGPRAPFPGGILNLPTLGDQSKKSSSISERGFHREMRQVVQRKERSVAISLLLPCHRPLGADAAQHARAVLLLGDLHAHCDQEMT